MSEFGIAYIECPACEGSGYGIEEDDPQDTPFCYLCNGDGEISDEAYDKWLKENDEEP